WRADGRFLLYVRNGRDGARGAPEIFRWDVAKAKATQLTGPGYLEPSYSPDGAYIAATRATSFGNDVVILDAAHGRELLRVTTDGAAWAPVWSPAGDAIAFLHLSGQIVDLKLARLGGTGASRTVTDIVDLTQVSGLDGGSRPAWYIPPAELPAPSATPSPSPTTSSSAAGNLVP
ncbi:MAG: TolB protein, partial [Chloroflexota bacterium]|nr:TolB protein [Chloroflexota bacterium]